MRLFGGGNRYLLQIRAVIRKKKGLEIYVPKAAALIHSGVAGAKRRLEIFVIIASGIEEFDEPLVLQVPDSIDPRPALGRRRLASPYVLDHIGRPHLIAAAEFQKIVKAGAKPARVKQIGHKSEVRVAVRQTPFERPMLPPVQILARFHVPGIPHNLETYSRWVVAQDRSERGLLQGSRGEVNGIPAFQTRQAH
jgi:hypothetical protein